MAKVIYILIILFLSYIIYTAYKTNELPSFVIKAIDKIKAIKDWIVKKFKKKEE